MAVHQPIILVLVFAKDDERALWGFGFEDILLSAEVLGAEGIGVSALLGEGGCGQEAAGKCE